jgi:hypothetical protein
MRLSCVVVFVLTLAGFAVGQQAETNFSQGPQYLITTTSPEFLVPIQTPSMSPDQQFGMVSPQTGQFVPIIIPATPVPVSMAGVNWGWSVPQVVEVEAPPEPSPFPPGYFEVGVTAIATEQWLHEHDYGMTIAQVARYWKEHRKPATHVYTNEDVQRLQGGLTY